MTAVSDHPPTTASLGAGRYVFRLTERPHRRRVDAAGLLDPYGTLLRTG